MALRKFAVNKFHEREQLYCTLNLYDNARAQFDLEFESAVLKTENWARGMFLYPGGSLPDDLKFVEETADNIRERRASRSESSERFYGWLNQQGPQVPPQMLNPNPTGPLRLLHRTLKGTHWYAGHAYGTPIWLYRSIEEPGPRRWSTSIFKCNHEFIYYGQVPHPPFHDTMRMDACLADMGGLIITLLGWKAMAVFGRPMPRITEENLSVYMEAPFSWAKVGEVLEVWKVYFKDGFNFADTKEALQGNSIILELAFLIIRCRSKQPLRIQENMDALLHMMQDCTGLSADNLAEKHGVCLYERAKANLLFDDENWNPFLIHHDCRDVSRSPTSYPEEQWNHKT